MSVKTIADIGLKIPARIREYYRYTGVSAELERGGAGSSKPELSGQRRKKQQDEDRQSEICSPAEGGI